MNLAAPREPWLRFRCDERLGIHRAHHELALTTPWTCIFGASGSGKTTLLRLLAGLLQQRNGTCQVQGHELRGVPAHRRGLALVDQAATMFPHLSVRQNVGFAGARRNGASVQQTLQRFDLEALAGARAEELSGGQKQRVAIARAVFCAPDALLLDESFSGMDRLHREHVRAALLATQAERTDAGRPMPIVVVTHDVAEVFATAAEVVSMEDGRIAAQGHPGEVLRDEREELLLRLRAGKDRSGVSE